MSDPTRAVTQALDDLARAVPLFAAAHRVLQDANASHPGAASYDGPMGGSGASSPVEALALGNDPTEAERKLLGDLVHRLSRDTHSLLWLVQRNTPHAPSPKQRAEVERTNDPDDCEHHAAAGIHEPRYVTSDVVGNLPHPMRLCEFCYQQVRRRGALPRADVMETRQRTYKNPKERVG